MPVLETRNMVALTREQREAVDSLINSDAQVQTLGGYAGTGKTTVIKTLARSLRGYAVMAYTGKAASVLRRKGVNATTIHSRIYEPFERESIVDGRRIVSVGFGLKDRDKIRCDGFIVDEASMVDSRIYSDLLSFDVPVIFVGDHGQLEPVSGGKFNLMAKPDITLTHIHRNAGEIARFAEYVRGGNEPSDWPRQPGATGEQVEFFGLTEVNDKCGLGKNWFFTWEQIICGRNDTRVALNELRRRMLGHPEDRPVKGDRVMCLQNDKQTGVYNGMQGEITALFGDEMVFQSEGKDIRVRFTPDAFNVAKRNGQRDRNGRIPFDYAYAITCHKAQGDEFDNVLVFEQRSRVWDSARWAYTAASRARKRLAWLRRKEGDDLCA